MINYPCHVSSIKYVWWLLFMTVNQQKITNAIISNWWTPMNWPLKCNNSNLELWKLMFDDIFTGSDVLNIDANINHKW